MPWYCLISNTQFSSLVMEEGETWLVHLLFVNSVHLSGAVYTGATILIIL
jgi:hypothetical protein